ncbi:RE1-silencing transcription factor [Galendromus occidentalis]|uniref:RE1-silencing transcription factor n=1 Tax=Galendromus occidentalis TaxID=34638 RepID=A0AAJ7L4H1_9ACAR|nr:RE1-silencing transcription factor [Galendromus occidentalis]
MGKLALSQVDKVEEMMDPVCHVGASTNPSQFEVPEDMQHLGIGGIGIGDGHHNSFVNTLIYSQESDGLIMGSDELATEIVGEIMPVPETVAQHQEVIHMDLARDEIIINGKDMRDRSPSRDSLKDGIVLEVPDIKQELAGLSDEDHEEIVENSTQFFLDESSEVPVDNVEEITSDLIQLPSKSEPQEEGQITSGYSCLECGAVLRSRAIAKEHLTTVHNYQCKSKKKSRHHRHGSVSSTSVLAQDALTLNSTDANGVQTYRCPSCSYSTHRRDKLDKHAMKHVLQDGFHPCGKKRHRPEAPPQRHRHNAEEYHCPYCPYGCTVYKALIKHEKMHLQGKETPLKISCKVCGKDRSSEDDMNKHMRKHRQGENFGCDICDFTSIQLKKVIQHRRMHTGEKPHLCPHCSYRSARRDNLRSHVRRMHKKDNMYIDTFNPTGGSSGQGSQQNEQAGLEEHTELAASY